MMSGTVFFGQIIHSKSFNDLESYPNGFIAVCEGVVSIFVLTYDFLYFSDNIFVDSRDWRHYRIRPLGSSMQAKVN